jgi:hypoxanthine phosphoribosyltransferase
MTAVLQHKTCSAFTPDFYVQKIIKWRWIIYPWARYEDFAGVAEKIIQDRALDLSQIINEFRRKYSLEIKKTELIEILDDLTKRGEIKKIRGEPPAWRVSRD